MNNVRSSDRRGTISHFISRGNNKIPLKRCCALYLNFQRAANSIMFLMPAALSAWPINTQVEQRGLMRFGLPTFVSGYKLTVEKRKREFVLCYDEISI